MARVAILFPNGFCAVRAFMAVGAGYALHRTEHGGGSRFALSMAGRAFGLCMKAFEHKVFIVVEKGSWLELVLVVASFAIARGVAATMDILVAGGASLLQTKEGGRTRVLRKAGQRERFLEFSLVAFFASQPFMAARQLEIDVGMVKVFAVQILPCHIPGQRKIGAEMFRMAGRARGRTFPAEVGVEARIVLELASDFEVADQTAFVQSPFRMAFLARTDRGTGDRTGMWRGQRTGRALVKHQKKRHARERGDTEKPHGSFLETRVHRPPPHRGRPPNRMATTTWQITTQNISTASQRWKKRHEAIRLRSS